MRRRRNLRLPSSSSDDEIPPRPQSVNTQISNPRYNPRTLQNAPFEISDDEFMDVEDALSEHFSPPDSIQNPGLTSDHFESNKGDPFDVSVGQIDEFFRRIGLGLRKEWIASCLSSLALSFSGFEGFDVAAKARMCFEQFLCSDMNYCGAGILPENVQCLNKVELKGPFVLQVDEVTNISCPLQERYRDSPAGLKRCLKLLLSDGMQHVFGLEYMPIHDLDVLSSSGLKIIIRNVQFRRGLFLLLPEVVEVLGGMVEGLDAARQRVVNEISKPPRGKRKQALLPLCQRATLAAWASTTVNSSDANTSDNHINNVSQENVLMPPTLSNHSLVQDVRRTSGTATERSYTEENVGPYTGRDSMEDLISQDFDRNRGEGFVHAKESISERPNYDSSLNVESSIAADISNCLQDEYAMDEADAINEFNKPTLLTGEKEIPFTYLACLLAEWIIEKDKTSFIQGRIKCILTGVKRFQFKRRSTYELLVYVDDGSYISEVFIDHNVVQRGIGYSPEDVAAALSSSDKKIKADMTEIMKKYQLFLSMFEGTLLLEISKNSPLPIVLEMCQGCSASDAWLLLRRLKSFTTMNPQDCCTGPIILSP